MAKVDAEKQKGIAEVLGIFAFPSVFGMKDGIILDNFVGGLPQDEVLYDMPKALTRLWAPWAPLRWKQFQGNAAAVVRNTREAESPRGDTYSNLRAKEMRVSRRSRYCSDSVLGRRQVARRLVFRSICTLHLCYICDVFDVMCQNPCAAGCSNTIHFPDLYSLF